MKLSARSVVIRELVALGYEKGAGGVLKRSEEIAIIFDPGISRKNGLFSVSVGIWISCLNSDFPKRFWNAHIYGGAEFLFPKLRDTVVHLPYIIKSEADVRFVEDAARLFAMHGENLLTISKVREAFLLGDFSRCMILKEARHFLDLP